MAANDSVLEGDSTKSGADGDNNHRSEGGQGEGSVKVKMIANVPVTKLEGLLRKLYDEDSEKYDKMAIVDIRRVLETRLNLPPRTLKKAEGLVGLIERLDTDMANEKDKEREKGKKKGKR